MSNSTPLCRWAGVSRIRRSPSAPLAPDSPAGFPLGVRGCRALALRAAGPSDPLVDGQEASACGGGFAGGGPLVPRDRQAGWYGVRQCAEGSVRRRAGSSLDGARVDWSRRGARQVAHSGFSPRCVVLDWSAAKSRGGGHRAPSPAGVVVLTAQSRATSAQRAPRSGISAAVPRPKQLRQTPRHRGPVPYAPQATTLTFNVPVEGDWPLNVPGPVCVSVQLLVIVCAPVEPKARPSIWTSSWQS